VPCYNEGEEELKKTIDSVRDESYPKDKKLLLFIADGNIKGKNNDGKDNYDTTPAILSDLLGYKRTGNDPIYSCDSTGYETGDNGEKTPVGNRAKVYHGTTKEGLNYMVIEKCGRPIEGDSGNRGKRDSQIILLQLLNKIQHNQKHRFE
jgi:chitin synthase